MRPLLLIALLAALAGALLYQARTAPPIDLLRAAEQFIQQAEITAPQPLRGPLDQRGGELTQAGIFAETNRHRTDNGVGALTASPALNRAAASKLADMFAQQYFEHVSPGGRGPADLVDETGYQYLRVGENLALGNYQNDAALVQAWMDSPGHRENILDPGFTEIGIAAARGTFEGHATWLAVQTFALPASACPAFDTALRRDFEQRLAEHEAEQQELEALRTELENEEAALQTLANDIDQLAADGNKKIRAGNEEIEEGNRIYQQTDDRDQAEPHWQRGAALQAEGRTLHAQAEEKQTALTARQQALQEREREYNRRAAQVNEGGRTLRTLAEKLNRQIRQYNTCLTRFARPEQ